jgi:hypothetical protein
MRKTHIVIGGGTSGLMLCNTLLERDDVILIENGDSNELKCGFFSKFICEVLNVYSQFDIWSYRAFIQTFRTSTYSTANQNALRNREMIYVQGRGFGGSSNVNAMIWTPGCASVFDNRWSKAWSSKIISVALSKVFSFAQPITISTSGIMKLLICGSFELSKESLTSADLWEDSHPIHCNYFSTTETDGLHRVNLAKLVLSESNLNSKIGRLTILRNTAASNIAFDVNNKAEAVITKQVLNKNDFSSERVTPLNGGEIILCAGVFESPRILIRSGLLRSARAVLSIESPAVNALPDLADIGLDMQDHIVLPLMFLGNWYSDWSILHSPAASDGYCGKPRYPLNGVHGWVNLDAQGRVHRTGDEGATPR